MGVKYSNPEDLDVDEILKICSKNVQILSADNVSMRNRRSYFIPSNPKIFGGLSSGNGKLDSSAHFFVLQ